jgi:enediyne biosynthesis protein E4
MTSIALKNSLYLFLIVISHGLSGQLRFTDVTDSAGISHQFKVFEGMFGGGICVFDLDQDGYEDLYITSGTLDDQLLLNNGNGTFKNIFEGSGLEVTRHFATQGVAGADVNRDGHVDLVITTLTELDSSITIPRAINLLFINNGNNTFRNATEEFGLGDLYAFSTGVSFGDFNIDGFPDIYIGNYFLEYDGPLTEINDATIVNSSKTAKGYLLLNQNGEKFINVFDDYGLNHRGFGFGGLFTDYDNDGDSDLLINHDFGYKAKPNYLLKNLYPTKKFEYVEEAMNMDLRINAMASAVGDYNNDGFFDYFITNIKYNWFMVNGGVGEPFENKAKELGMSYFTISWGANFADFDHDGDLDLFVANGDLNPNCTPMYNYLFQNNGQKFIEFGREAGLHDYGMGRGSVIFDIENDGDMDILVVNQIPIKDYPVESRTKLYRNDTPSGNWLKVALDGVQSESHGIGSKVELIVDGLHLIREIDGGGSSHLSQNSTIAHFGLDSISTVDSLIVHWLGGHKQYLVGVPVNQLISITEVRNSAIGRSWLIWLLIGSGLSLLMYFLVQRMKNNAN